MAWVTEGLAHTIIGLVDDMGNSFVVSYYDWAALVHEADLVITEDEHDA